MKEKKEVCLLDRKEKVLCIFWAAGVTALVDFLFYGTLWVMLLTPVTAGFLMKRRKILLEKRRKKRMTKQFGDMMISLCVALRAGYSMENALAECARDLEKLHGEEAEMVAELKYIRNQMQISIPVEKLLSQLGERTGVEDIQSFVNVYAIAKRTGGNLEQVLQNTAVRLRDKMEVMEEIEACIAAKKMEERIMGCMPCGIILYLRLLSPGFLDPLYGNVLGAAVMTVCLAVYMAALRMGEKIVDIEV